MFFHPSLLYLLLFFTYYSFYFCRDGSHNENHGLGVERPSELRQNDDEFDAYRKRMMLAYRFRPNPLVRYILNLNKNIYSINILYG